MRTAICKGCGAEIIWAKTANGKNTPLDVKPILTWLLKPPIDEWMAPTATPFKSHQTHWATCPKASDFKQKKGGD